jgi:hypothetical protein
MAGFVDALEQRLVALAAARRPGWAGRARRAVRGDASAWEDRRSDP